MKTKLLIFILIFGMFSGINMFAQSEEEHGEGHHFHRNHVSFLVGGTTHLEKGAGTYFSLGADYVYRISNLIGIGVVGELIFAEKTEYLLALPIVLYATESLWFQFAPGFEVAHHSVGDGNGHGQEAHSSSEVLSLIRIGGGYNFHVGGLSISPSINLDMFRSRNSLVWGIAIGKGF